MSRALKLTLIAAAVTIGLVAIGALWSLDYALAYLVIYRRFDVLHAVWNDRDWLLPVEQVRANLGRAELGRLIRFSTLALIVEIAGAGGVIGYFIAERRRNVGPDRRRPLCRRIKSAQGGPSRRRRRNLDPARTLRRQRGPLQRR